MGVVFQTFSACAFKHIFLLDLVLEWQLLVNTGIFLQFYEPFCTRYETGDQFHFKNMDNQWYLHH